MSPPKPERFSSSQKESSASKGRNGKFAISHKQDEDLIGESIQIEESGKMSYKGSSIEKSAKSSSMKSRSAGKAFSSAKDPEDEDSLERDEDENYSNDFVSESIETGSKDSASKSHLQS